MPGKTSKKESGASIDLEADGDVTILFFDIDSPAGRECLGLGDEDRVCDLLVLICRSDARPVVGLLELKGTEFDHGVTQIESARQAVQKKLASAFRHYTVVKAVIRKNHTSAPRSSRGIKRKRKQRVRQNTGSPRALKSSDVTGKKVTEFLRLFGIR